MYKNQHLSLLSVGTPTCIKFLRISLISIKLMIFFAKLLYDLIV
jgi:hypothetical protein